MNRKLLTLMMASALFGCANQEPKTGSDYSTPNSKDIAVPIETGTNSDSDLNTLNIKGNVTRIETIAKSTIPLTEMFFATFDPSQIVSPSDGNYVIDFDKNGNVKSYKGYGIDGSQLFSTKVSKRRTNLFPGMVGTADKNLEGLSIGKVKKDSLQRIQEMEYLLNRKPKYVMQLNYNEQGNPDYISKVYFSDFGERPGESDLFIDFNNYDTTFFTYTRFDNHGNWIEVVAEYHGVLPRHNHSYTVERQITYAGSTSQPPLIMSIKESNQCPSMPLNEATQVVLTGFGWLSLPTYMAVDNETARTIEQENFARGFPQKYLCMYQYDGEDAYATFSISTLPAEFAPDYESLSPKELNFDQDIDDYLRETISSNLEQTGTGVLKWLPYQFVRVDDNLALRLSYYRYGIGSPLPVYVETYEFKARDGRDISISLSYQSNHFNRFHDDFDACLKSIRLY